jgi:hypothetical protein
VPEFGAADRSVAAAQINGARLSCYLYGEFAFSRMSIGVNTSLHFLCQLGL